MPLNRIREKKQQQKKQNQKLIGRAKTQYLNLKAPCNNVKLQSDKTFTTQIYIFLTKNQMGFFVSETR